LPSKEGLRKCSSIYFVPSWTRKVGKIIETYGLSYENIISNVFRLLRLMLVLIFLQKICTQVCVPILKHRLKLKWVTYCWSKE
jgi:hypothetical protein